MVNKKILTYIGLVTDKDGYLTKGFQKENRDSTSQLLKEYANSYWSRR